MHHPAGMTALAVAYPRKARTNEFWTTHYADAIAAVENARTTRVWSRDPDAKSHSSTFDRAMAPYLDDPFRGTKLRRVVGSDETSLTLELRAARDALAAASLAPSDVDLLISAAFFPSTIAVGHGVHLARELGLRCAGINLETACAGAVVGLQTACALVSSGQCRNVLVTLSCAYSVVFDPTNPMSWVSGDGAGAFVVSTVPEGYGFVAGHSINTAETIGAIRAQVIATPAGEARLQATANPSAGKLLRESAVVFLDTCVSAACRRAARATDDVDFFVFNTPTAWYADFCAAELGIPREKTIDTYPLYANTGPALTTGNLFHALLERRITPGDLVLLYAPGSASSASAALMRLGGVHLGPVPAPPETYE